VKKLPFSVVSQENDLPSLFLCPPRECGISFSLPFLSVSRMMPFPRLLCFSVFSPFSLVDSGFPPTTMPQVIARILKIISIECH
jgi:hypothetical protein